MNSGTIGTVLYFAVMIGIMYMIIFLPQRRRDKKHRELLSTLQPGRNITTIGGVAGKVINIKDDEITIETSVERTQIVIKKWGIKEVEKIIEA